MKIEVTEVRIKRIAQQGGLVAIARIVINQGLVLDGIGIHAKLDGSGYRLTYPTRPNQRGESYTLFHPINQSVTQTIEKAIFSQMEPTQKAVSHDRHHPTTL